MTRTGLLAAVVEDDGGEDYDRSLRPRRLTEFVGQERVREQLEVALEDTARFEAIPGIGRKTAQRVVLELKEKLASAAVASDASGAASPELVARDALVSLGYSLVEAERVLAEVDPDLPAEERVKLALRKAA